MPATSEKQKNFMKMVLAHKDGKLDMSEFNDAMKERIAAAAKSMTKKELHDFVDAPVKETKDITFTQYLEYVAEMSSCEDEELGFKKLQAKIEAQGKSPEAAAAIAASISRKKLKKDVNEAKKIGFESSRRDNVMKDAVPDKVLAGFDAWKKKQDEERATTTKKNGKAKFQKMAVAGKK